VQTHRCRHGQAATAGTVTSNVDNRSRSVRPCEDLAAQGTEVARTFSLGIALDSPGLGVECPSSVSRLGGTQLIECSGPAKYAQRMAHVHASDNACMRDGWNVSPVVCPLFLDSHATSTACDCVSHDQRNIDCRRRQPHLESIFAVFWSRHIGTFGIHSSPVTAQQSHAVSSLGN
jgi:hypothetical protein